MPFEPGQVLSHYRFVEKIGEGGMGVVWRAVDTTLDRDVAIKVLPEELASDPARLKRFEREAKLLAALNHSRIAALYGLHQVEEMRFLSMELVHGEDLAQHLLRGPLSQDQALRIALQLAEGLEAAHERGIIHRDLKPANIKLTADGEVKILDFGLAKALRDPPAAGQVDPSRSPTITAAATQAGVILGTAAYMSPEQSRGQEVDRRTDVWAFGCVLYELLTGRGVFRASTASDCIAGILGREPDWETLPPDTTPAVRRLLRRCLEKNPRRRLHDIADARIEIEDALVGDDDAPAAGPRRGWPRLAWAAAGLLVGALAMAFVFTQRDPGQAVGAGIPARLSVELPTQAPVVPEPGNSTVAISADGTRLVYVGLDAHAASAAVDTEIAVTRSTRLFTRRLDEYDVVPIEGTDGAVAPFLSPDGEWVGFVDAGDGTLKKTRLQGGVPVPICEGLDIRGVSWGPDGKIYIGGGGLRVVSEDGGVAEPLTEADHDRGEKTHRFPHVLPGGKALLFTLGTGDIASYDEAAIALLDLRTGEYRILMNGGSNPVYAASGHILYGRSGTLEAVPFDLESLQVTGPPFVVASGVVTSGGFGSAHYAISDNGTLAYVPGGPERFQRSIYWLDRSGKIEAVPLPRNRYGTAVFSPDGRQLAFTTLGGNASVWTYDIERKTMNRLTTEWDNWGPRWTRDGSHIVFSSNRSGTNALWLAPADGSQAPELLYAESRIGLAGSWSADDRSLAFYFSTPETSYDIWLLSAEDGWRAEPLFRTAFQEEYPAFSPDGRWLAYTSDDTGQSELYVQPFPVTGRKWQVSVGGARAPLWSPDGRELYYWKGTRFMAVPISAGSDLAPGKPRPLPHPEFTHLRSWDIAPDGRRFVLVGQVASAAETDTQSAEVLPGLQPTEANVHHLQVVVDWFETLRQANR